METTRKDKYISAATPILIFTFGAISPWAMLVAPAMLYFIYRKISASYAQLTALKIFDLSISLLALAFGLGLLNSALLIVAHDGELTIPLISSGLSKYIIAISLIGYYLAYLIIFTVSSFRQKIASPYLSFKIFESLRGKRAVTL
ncbi:hypothetical protein [Pseudomonas sp.]|uniref:hypothetical protein n=1 Tax=Pseudomonas sp. TaxID=306 RepID=UPI003BB763A7